MYDYLKFIEYKMRQLMDDLEKFVNVFDQIIASDFKMSGIKPCEKDNEAALTKLGEYIHKLEQLLGESNNLNRDVEDSILKHGGPIDAIDIRQIQLTFHTNLV